MLLLDYYGNSHHIVASPCCDKIALRNASGKIVKVEVVIWLAIRDST